MMIQAYRSGCWYLFLAGIGGAIGVILGLISDFGFIGMIENIHLNWETFDRQYLPILPIILFVIIFSAAGVAIDRLIRAQATPE